MLSDVLNSKIRELQAEEELAMGCCCNECEDTADCNGAFTFYFATCTSGVPTIEVGDELPFEIIESNLRCVRENCSVTETITTPCGNTIDCQVCLSRFRYIGCIRYSCNIPTGALASCAGGTFFIDRVRCYTCANDCETAQCPTDQEDFIDGDITAVVSAITPILDPNGNVIQRVVTVEVTLDLTSPCNLPG